MAGCSPSQTEPEAKTSSDAEATSPTNLPSFTPYETTVEIPMSGDAQLVGTVTATGQKVVAVILKYPEHVLGSIDLNRTFTVDVENYPTEEGVVTKSRTITSVHTASRPQLSNSEGGNYVVIHLDPTDEAAGAQAIKVLHEDPITVHAGTPDSVATKEIKQANKIPVDFDGVTYRIQQIGNLTTVDGKALDPRESSIELTQATLFDPAINEFETGTYLDDAGSAEPLQYRFRKAKKDDAPLVVFLHGSGQYGDDNRAHILSSRGAVGVLDWEDAYVLAPQYKSVFDPAEPYGENAGGIHWQSTHRQEQVIGLIKQIIEENPGIDRSRIYIQGLSRGGEGALGILTKEPDIFAAGLIMSGRELKSIELVSHRSSVDDLTAVKDIPLWFFHAKADEISPIEGTRTNVQHLDELGAKAVRYTEFDTAGNTDNGWINKNPHNTWDATYNSPDVWSWLLSQTKK